MKRAGVHSEAQQSAFLLKPAAVAVAMALGLGLGARPSHANPTGPTVVNGQVTIKQAGNLLSITNSPSAIINWQAFSIGASEITRFTQQSATSAVLNRVVGSGGTIDPSVILGALQSNGRVFLLNPSGIVFGAGSQIDVAGLVASSLNLSNADFLGGRLKFSEVPGAGAVVNRGSINAAAGGQVYLVGPSVANHGVITSPKGEVILAAGNTVELVNPGTPNLRVEVSAPDNEAKNLGSIVAEAGRVGIYAGLINHGGVIRADSAVATEDGRIVLKAARNVNLDAGSVTTANGPQGGRIEINAGDTMLAAGAIEAKGATGQGGLVHLLGDKVGVYGSARVDVSGQTGGGTVLAGGEYQGKPGVTAVEGTATRNATATYFGPDASIAADAGASGDGGRIILWSDHTTRSYGEMSARGGAVAGNGGLVETSGKVSLEVTRGPDVRAPHGLGGTWLLDPNNLIVDSGAVLVNNSAQPQFFTLGESSVVGVELINLQLDAGSNVLLTTTSAPGAPAGAQAGDIIIRAPIVKRASTNTASTPPITIGTTSLIVQANNNIIIEGAGGIAATQNVLPSGTTAQADPLNVTLTAALSGTGGGVTIGGTGISTNGGFVSITGRDQVAINAPVNTARINSVTGLPGPGGAFSATANGPGAALTVGSAVTSTGATLIADAMNIDAAVNAGAGGITTRQSTAGRAMSLGTEIGSALSLTQAELSNLVTSGPSTFGNAATGAFTVGAPINVGSSSVSMSSGTSFAVNPGASLTTAVPLTVNAPSITVDGAVSAQQVNLTTDTIVVNAPVNSSGNIDVSTRSFGRAVNLGAGTDGAASLDFSQGELNNLMNAASSALRISGAGGAMMVQGAVSRVGAGALRLTGATLGQATGATITADNLRLNFTTANLPEANAITTLAGSVGNLTLNNPSLLTIGTVDGTSGLSTSTATVMTDDLNVVNAWSGNTTNIKTATAGRRINLGGADVAGELNISGTDLSRISGTTVALAADLVDIRGAVSSPATTLSIAPVTAGRALNIIAGPAKTGAALELTPAEIASVTANTFQLGDATTGPVSVGADPAAPGTIQTFRLRTGDPAGITTSSPLTAARNIELVANSMAIGGTVTATAGNIAVATHSGVLIDLGGDPGAGTLGLSSTEISHFNAPGGTLSIGNSTATGLTVSNPIAFTNVTGAQLATGGTLTNVGTFGTLTSPGNLFLSANTMAVNASISAGGDINVGPVSNSGISLGSKPAGVLGLTDTELDFLNPGTAGILRIGNSLTSGIQVNAPISPTASTLSLVSNGGTIGQTGTATINVANLAVRNNGFGGIALGQAPNTASNVALRASFGDVSYTYGGTGPLNIGSTIDGVQGVVATNGNVTLATDEIAIGAAISGRDVTITRGTTGALDVGSKLPGMALGITQAEFDRITANALYLGGNLATSSVSTATVSAPITIGTAIRTFGIASTGGGATGLQVNSGSGLTSSSGDIILKADGMTLNAAVKTNATSGKITVQPFNPQTAVDIGGPDVVSTTNILGLNAADIANLQAPNIVINGNGSVPSPAPASIYVSSATDFGSRNVQLATQTGGNLAVNAGLATTGDLTLSSDTFVIGAPVSGGNVTLKVLDSSRSVDLGTSGSGSFALTNTALAQIGTSASGTFTLDAGTINVLAATAFPGASNVALKFNNASIANTVTSNGRLTVAARDSFSFNLLSSGLTPAAINNLRTTGVLQIGDTSTGTVNINQPVMPDAGVSALALVSSSGISQTAGSTITTPNLAIRTFGSVNLTENNSVGMLAAQSSGTFNFTSTGPLTVGPTVDGLSGVTSFSNATVKADDLNVAAPASGTTSMTVSGTLALAPRVATDTISVGSEPGGFGVSTTELSRISAGTLQFGTATHAGPINVTTAITRPSGSLSLLAGPGGSVNVNGAVTTMANGAGIFMSAPTVNLNAPVNAAGLFSSVGLTGSGANGSVNVNANAPVTAQSNVTVTADNVEIAARIGSSTTTPLSSATVQPATSGRPVSLGTETSGAMSLTAAELALINSSALTLGSSSAGPMSINAELKFPALDQLTLRSNGSITQNPDAPILLQKVLPNGQRVGDLVVSSTTGSVDLRAANEIPGFITASGSSTQDFLFNNALPTRLQNVSVTGLRAVVNGGLAGPLVPPPVEPPSGPPLLPPDPNIIGLNDAIDFCFDCDQERLKKEDEERKKQQECR